jgi:tRNA G18 (ribose-2'-O)-methylase SpoU
MTNRKLHITELERLSQQEFQSAVKTPLVIVLDNVRSLHNVGSVFRSSDAFLAEAVYLCGITSVPPHPEIHKTALGAEDSVEWRYFEDTITAVDDLKAKGYVVYAVEQAEGSIPLNYLRRGDADRIAVVLGHEVKGVQQAVIDRCDGCIEIPQFGTKHSLNVSVAGGIVIWELFKLLNHGLER